jgi:hypothetical protein
MYALTVTNAVNGCESSATVSVSQDITAPVVTSHVSGMLTCSVTQVTLNAVSPAAGLLYSWSGPGSFVSNQQNPGVYTVTATNPVNGCTSTSTVTVEQNLQLPENVAASYTGTGIITCSTPSVTLTGSSTTSGVTYNWSGPGTISNPTSATVSVTTPGLYTVTVTNPLNNCTVSEGVTVNQNTIAPQNVTITPPAPLTCTRLSTTLQASSSTSGVTYQWTGTGAITNPTSSTASVSTAGTYNLVVTNPVNGCTTTPPAVIVSSNTTLPTVSISTPDGVALSCFVNPVRLNGSSTTPGVTYQWTNTEGLSVAQQNLLATVPSDYTLTVTDPVNGCQRSTTRRITQTLTNPTATASVSGVINCLAPSVNLLGSSSGSPVTYSWSGPSGFTSAAQNPPVSIPGTYVLTITTPGGCTATASTNVQQNSTLPANVTYEVSGPLDDCGSDIVVLSANSTTPGAFYSWTGPDDFESTEQDAVTTAAGVYTLVVTHPLSGCSETREVTVLFEPCPETLFSRSATNGKLAVQNNAEEVMTWGDGLFTVGVYPNPTRGKASIEFIPDGNYRVMVEVYSPLNVKVATYNPGEVTAGRTYTVVFDPENHTSGVYLYRIHYGPGRTLEGRFIVTR